MEQTAQQLGQMAELARAQAGDSAAQLFETHAMFLEDEDYTGAMEELLAEGYCAEYAVDQAGEQFSAMLAAMDDPYMQARASDVRAISDRMLRILTGRGTVPPVSFLSFYPGEHRICSQPDHHPRPLLYFGLYCYARQCTEHAAALSRALSIPALVKLDLSASLEGHTALLDGGAQKLYVDPTPDILSRLGPPDPSIRLSTPNQYNRASDRSGRPKALLCKIIFLLGTFLNSCRPKECTEELPSKISNIIIRRTQMKRILL